MDEPASTPAGIAPRALTPEEARYELQAILGQIHGLMSKAIEHPENWCPPELITALVVAYGDIGRAFGSAQAALNTGKYDAQLVDWGLAGAQMEPKKRGFWQALRQFFDPVKNGEPPLFGALGSATRWGGIIVGSLAREVPGAEVIKEGMEVIYAAREQYRESHEANQRGAPAPAPRRGPEESQSPQ